MSTNNRKPEPHFRFVEVPPPKTAHMEEISETLGLCRGLKAQRSRYKDPIGCHHCREEIQLGDWYVLVPDSVCYGDSPASVTEQCRMQAFNGEFSSWCLKCSRELSGHQSGVSDVESAGLFKGLWRKFRQWRKDP